MDEAVKTLRAGLALALLAAAACAQAQALQDPTRPPDRFTVRAAGAPAPSAAPQLQSVLIARGEGGRRVAVIDGEPVRLGERFRGARVARVTQDEVELVRGGERQVLKLYGPAGLPTAAAGSAAAVTAAAAPATLATARP
jgi:MSHA biogenesis protein MshK